MEEWLGNAARSLTCTERRYVNHKQLYLQDYDKSTWLPTQWTVARVQIIALSSIASSFSFLFRVSFYIVLSSNH
jgi:hypothetical protein